MYVTSRVVKYTDISDISYSHRRREWKIVQCYRIDRGPDLSPVQGGNSIENIFGLSFGWNFGLSFGLKNTTRPAQEMDRN